MCKCVSVCKKESLCVCVVSVSKRERVCVSGSMCVSLQHSRCPVKHIIYEYVTECVSIVSIVAVGMYVRA